MFNGEDFIGKAVERGAVAVVARPRRYVERVPHLADPEPRRLFADLAAKFYAPYPGHRRRGDRHQRQDLDGRDDPPDLAHVRASLGLDRHARRDHVRRPGEDRADDARHRHLPQQYGRARADGHQPRRLRGVEPRPRPASRRGRAARRRRLHQLQPRPSRLSRDDGRLFRSQDAAVRGVACAGQTGGDLDRRSQVRGSDRARRAPRAQAAHGRTPGRDDPPRRSIGDPARPGAATRA